MTKLTIVLTNRRPVTITEGEWPVIASASGDDCTILDPARRDQALEQGHADEYSMEIRRHSDGRIIVYGSYTEGLNSMHKGYARAGTLLADDADDIELVKTIRRVGVDLAVPSSLIASVIAELPAEEL
jgi:hypothetical protein